MFFSSPALNDDQLVSTEVNDLDRTNKELRIKNKSEPKIITITIIIAVTV